MDKTSFYRWFRTNASSLGVPDVGLRFMSPGQARGELGRFDPGENTIYIDERQLANDQSALHTAMHELAHAIVFKKNSEYLTRKDNWIAYDLNNPIAGFAIQKLQLKGGHSAEFRKVAANLGVNVDQYVDRHVDASPYGQLRRGIGFRRD